MGKLLKTIIHKQHEDVYDMNVENNHNFIANNVLVHNCLNY